MNQVIKIKRTTTPDNEPASLEVGELAAGLGNVPVKLWIGTPGGVKDVGIDEAPEDGQLYARKDGEWTSLEGTPNYVPITIEIDFDNPITVGPDENVPHGLWYTARGDESPVRVGTETVELFASDGTLFRPDWAQQYAPDEFYPVRFVSLLEPVIISIDWNDRRTFHTPLPAGFWYVLGVGGINADPSGDAVTMIATGGGEHMPSGWTVIPITIEAGGYRLLPKVDWTTRLDELSENDPVPAGAWQFEHGWWVWPPDAGDYEGVQFHVSDGSAVVAADDHRARYPVTFYYTIPGAGGFALQTDLDALNLRLGDYLPLAGGNLTGLLYGPGAYFGGVIISAEALPGGLHLNNSGALFERYVPFAPVKHTLRFSPSSETALWVTHESLVDYPQRFVAGFEADGGGSMKLLNLESTGGHTGPLLTRNSITVIDNAGNVHLPADPTQPLEAVTKQYVDALLQRIADLEARVEALENA